MRRWFLLLLLAGCGDDRLPGFATGDDYYGFDAGRPLDASIPADAARPDAGD